MHPKKISKILNKVIHTTAEKLLEYLPDNSIDLIVTSPPYGNLRDYNGFNWCFEKIAHESYRVLKQGGVLVWVVRDTYKNGSKELNRYKQALFFTECVKFYLHDEIIWFKPGVSIPQKPVLRYSQSYETCFVFSKGKPKSFNPILFTQIDTTRTETKGQMQRNGEFKKYKLKSRIPQPIENVWNIYGKGTSDRIAFNHPARFSEELVKRHILSWSNENDIVLDYFSGSGTTAKMSMLMARNYIGCDISKKYVDLANERLELYKNV